MMIKPRSKWISLLCCAVLLMTSLTLCAAKRKPTLPNQDLSAEETRAAFDALLQKDFTDSVTTERITLHSVLRDPQAYGIEDSALSWGDLQALLTEKEIRGDLAWIRQFRSLNRSYLSVEQQQSYDIFSYRISSYRESLDTYYYYDPFMGSGGYHAMMPIILGEYDFFDAEDVEHYLDLVGTMDVFFASLVELERERIRQGLFMTDAAVDEVISGCRDFIANRDTNILITTFSRRIEALQGADAAQKEQWETRNREIFSRVVVPVYENLIAEMQSMKGSGVNDQGYAHYPLGREYYVHRLRAMGISRTPEEIIRLLEQTVKDHYAQAAEIIQTDPQAMDFSTLSAQLTADEILQALKEAGSGSFPQLPENVRYDLTVIDESLKDFVAPAFYFVPRMDDYTSNSIYYNDDYFDVDRDYMFFVFAHEGYPGHLLQNVLLMAGDLPEWRKNVSFSAYSEGWATYVEYYAYSFLEAPPAQIEMARLSDELYMLMMLRMDIGIHYEGWSKDDLISYMDSGPFAAGYAAATLETIYDFILINAMNSVPYVTGLLEIRALADHYQTLLGDAYSDLLFHTELLKYGEAPFELLRQWMDESLLQSEPLAA